MATEIEISVIVNSSMIFMFTSLFLLGVLPIPFKAYSKKPSFWLQWVYVIFAVNLFSFIFYI